MQGRSADVWRVFIVSILWIMQLLYRPDQPPFRWPQWYALRKGDHTAIRGHSTPYGWKFSVQAHKCQRRRQDRQAGQAGRQLGSKNLTIPGRAGNRQGYYELIISNASPNQSSITTWTQACMHAHTPWENTCRSPVYFYIAASHPYCTSYFPPPTPPPRYPTIHTPAQPACRPHPLRLHRPGPWESHNQCSYLPLSPARHVVLTCPVLYPNTTSPHALSCHHQSGVSFHQQDGHLPSTECSLPIPKTPFLNPF